jgi:hypothetical protein
MVVVLLIAAATATVVITVQLLLPGIDDWLDVIQGLESFINEIVLLSVAIVFLVTFENRYKRRLALESLHRLRSIAHVIDMHQLTKDPAALLAPLPPTASSPERTMSRAELTRYLDYCSELLAITSKLAALHGQFYQDSDVISAINEIEILVQGLSGKIWQKIMILDVAAGVTETRAVAEYMAVPLRARAAEPPLIDRVTGWFRSLLGAEVPPRS